MDKSGSPGTENGQSLPQTQEAAAIENPGKLVKTADEDEYDDEEAHGNISAVDEQTHEVMNEQSQQNEEEELAAELEQNLSGEVYGEEDDDAQGLEDLNQEELNAIIESISSGKSQSYKKLTFQAFCAAISHEDQVRFVIDYLCNVSNTKANSKFATAKNRILAYRVSQMDPVQQKEILAEGFDDDGEDGSGDKLLTVLQKMDIGNIMVVVCIWNNGVTIGDTRLRGGEFFRMITDRARELLTSIKEGVLQGELEATQTSSPRRANIPQQQQNYDLLNKTDRSNAPGTTQKVLVGAQSSGVVTSDKIDQQILQLFKKALSEQDMQSAQSEIDESLNSLTKASLLELKAMAKPHPLVEKTMCIVVALRGYKNINWNTAKEMVGKPAFKIELLQVSPKTLRATEVLRAQQILTQKTNNLLTPENVQLHSEAAALLLIWAANIIKLYACWKRLGPPPEKATGIIKMDDMDRVTNKTKVILKNKHDEAETKKKADAEKAKKLKKEGIFKYEPKEKQSSVGHFLQSKKMMFSTDTAALEPDLVKEEQKNKKLVDINVIKKGLNYHGANSKNIKQEQDDILKEEEIQEREKAIANKNQKSFGEKDKDDKKAAKEAAAAKEAEGAKAAEEDEREGKLKMIEVQNLPDDVDLIVNNLKTLDFSIQDLDVLIELSRQLKYKRISLFPDTSYMLSLEQAGLTPDKIQKDMDSK